MTGSLLDMVILWAAVLTAASAALAAVYILGSTRIEQIYRQVHADRRDRFDRLPGTPRRVLPSPGRHRATR